jgi:hypothetical protein
VGEGVGEINHVIAARTAHIPTTMRRFEAIDGVETRFAIPKTRSTMCSARRYVDQITADSLFGLFSCCGILMFVMRSLGNSVEEMIPS